MTSGSNSFMSRTQSPDGGVDCDCIPRTKRAPNAAGDGDEISCCTDAVAAAVGVVVVAGFMAAVGNNVEPREPAASAAAPLPPWAKLSLRLAAK